MFLGKSRSVSLFFAVTKTGSKLEKLNRMINQFLEVSSEVEFSLERSAFYCVLVPVSVILPHLVKWRVVGWKPLEDAFLAFLYCAVKFGREKNVCYPVRVFTSVMFEKGKGSNASWSLDDQTSFFVDFSHSALFGILVGV